jgi:hypothetical protein
VKFLVDLTGFNCKYKFPQQGDKVFIKLPLTEEETSLTIQFNAINNILRPKDYTHTVQEVNSEGNEAGFGWVWLYNVETKVYDYKMSIFDKRTIPGNTEVPHVGYSNVDAYHIIKCREVVRTGFRINLANIWRYIKNGFRLYKN